MPITLKITYQKKLITNTLINLTEGTVYKQIFKFALPLLIGNMFQQLYNIVDSIIVGNFIGKQALAAVGASFPIIFLLVSLVLGIATGSTIVIAQYFGAKKLENVQKTVDTLIIVLFFASIIISGLGIIFSKQIFTLIGLPPELMNDATNYLNIYMLGFIIFFGFQGLSAVLRGIGDSKTPVYFLILATLINVALDLLFIVNFKLGVKGAAYATILSQLIAYIGITIFVNKRNKYIKLHFFKLKFDKYIFKQSMRIGTPAGIQTSFVALGMMALLAIVNKFGTTVIAGYSIATKVDALAMLPAMNFSMAFSTFVGQNIGADKLNRVKKGLFATFIMTSIISGTITLIIIFFGHNILSLFSPDLAVIEVGNNYLIIVSSFYLIFTTMFVINGVMRGAGDTLVPMFITLFALWFVRIPMAVFLSDKFNEIGIWWSVPIAWTTGLTLSFTYYKLGKWKNKSVVRPKIKINI